MEFTDIIDLYDNEANFNELIKQVGNVVPFIGAGLSASVFPTWRKYLVGLCKKYELKDTLLCFDSLSYEAIASKILSSINHMAFYSSLKSTFSSDRISYEKLGEAIKQLPSLFEGMVLTTNFDCALEYVYGMQGIPFERIIYPSFQESFAKAISGDRHYLVKLHGDIEENSFVVFTEEQYDAVYGKPFDSQKEFVKTLSTCIVGRTLLFIGCSIEEDRITGVLRSITSAYPHVQHFAILEAPSKKKYAERLIFLSSLGILPIFYPPKQYGYIACILDELQKKNTEYITLATSR